MFIAALFTVTKIKKQPKCPGVDETIMGHSHNGLLLDHKKDENFTHCNSMDGPGEHWAKCNKPGRERQIPYDFYSSVESNERTELTRKMGKDS